MKNNLWVITQKNHSKNSKLKQNIQQYINPELISIDNSNFYRINGNQQINTTGEQPLILYKKKQGKISHSFEYKMTKKNNDNNIYISDGGLKLKNQKYKTKYNYIYTKPLNNQYNEELKSIMTNYAMMYEKSAKKNNTINPKDNKRGIDEKIYYKTVRGYSNRPTFKKKYYNKSQEIRKDNIKIKKNLKKCEESKQSEDNKDLMKKNLIKGGKKSIRLLLKLIKNKKSMKNKNVEKKKEFLQKNGIGLSDVVFQNFDEEEKKQPEKEEIKKMSNTGNNFHRKINNYMKNYPGMSTEKKNICITLENDNYKNKHSQNKKSYKPIVDQFEFIKKINEEQKMIHTQENISKNKEQQEKLLLSLKSKNNKNNHLNDSFRHNTQNSHKKKSESKSKEKEKESLSRKKQKELPSSLIDILKDEWPYSHKRSYRSPKELKTFKKEKRVLKREKANIEELEKNTKLFNKFKNLVNLNYKRGMQNKEKDKEKNKNIEKLTITKSLDINKTHRANHARKNNFPLKKGKEMNEYYIGNNSIMNNNNSTLVEIDRYYLNVLESQKLLVDSGFSRKNYYDETNDISENEKKGDEDIYINSKERMNKFLKKNKNDMRNIKNKNVKINNYIKHKDKINNKKTKVIKKLINSKDVFKLVEIIKFIIQRKVYATIYKYYIELEIHKNYHLAFSYLVAICKNYAFRKIVAYSDYQSYHIVIKKLFLPFIRRNFRYFIGVLNFKRKLRYFIYILNKFFKFKVFERIYNSSQIEDNPANYFKLVIFKIMKTLFKPHLKEVFDKLNNYRIKERDDKYRLNKEENSDKKDVNKIQKINKENNNINDNYQDNSDKYKKIAKRYLEYSPTFKKARSYLYESFSDDNSFSVRANSLDNHQWAKIQAKLQLARYRMMSGEFENEEIEDNTDENDSDKINDHMLSNKKEHKKEKKFDKEKVINIKKNKEIKNNNSDESSISLKDDLIKDIKNINEPKSPKNKDINKEVKPEEIKKEKPIDVQENKNSLMKMKTLSDNDISAERDENNEIEWEYNLEDKNKNINEKNKENIKKPDLIDDSDEEKEKEKCESNKKELKKDRKFSGNEEDDYLGEFENVDLDIKSDSDLDSARKKEKKEEKEKEKEIEPKKKEEKKEENIEIKIKEEEKKKPEENKIIEENKIQSKPKESEKLKNLDKIKNLDKFSNELTEEIIKKIISSEIASQEIKLIPYKSFKYDIFSNLNLSQSNSVTGSGGTGNNINKELGLLGLGQLSLTDDLASLNDSIMSSYSAFSVFNKTVKDKKKEHSLNLYFKKIAPRLIKLIKEEIIKKYPRIYANISTPLRNKSVGLMMSLCLQDADMLRDNYKCTEMKESIRNIIDKEEILKKFEPINRQIRTKDKLTSDNFYDNMLNDCLIDTTIELINKERLYGENGDPLDWSSRTHELVFKFNKSDAQIFAKHICKNLIKTMVTRVGLITENYDYLNAEQINDKREKKLIDNIKSELDEDEYQWRNLEMEETQLKVEIAELIMEQLYNENIEILEHIQYSRNRPDLYLNKSIYACEEIPKLSFQQTTTENNAKDKEENDEVNMN